MFPLVLGLPTKLLDFLALWWEADILCELLPLPEDTREARALPSGVNDQLWLGATASLSFLDPTLTPGFALHVSYLLEGSFYPHEDFYYSPLTFQLFSNKGYFTYSILTIFEDRGHTKFFPHYPTGSWISANKCANTRVHACAQCGMQGCSPAWKHRWTRHLLVELPHLKILWIQGWDVTQRFRTCLACARPWAPP